MSATQRLIEAAEDLMYLIDEGVPVGNDTTDFKRLEQALAAAKEEQAKGLDEDSVKKLTATTGIYITLLPHGYEIDFVDHKKMLDTYMDDREFFKASECQSYGDDIDVNEGTQKIIEAVRSLDSRTPANGLDVEGAMSAPAFREMIAQAKAGNKAFMIGVHESGEEEWISWEEQFRKALEALAAPPDNTTEG